MSSQPAGWTPPCSGGAGCVEGGVTCAVNSLSRGCQGQARYVAKEGRQGFKIGTCAQDPITEPQV